MRFWRWARRRPADDGGIDVRALAIRHLIRGHSGEALLCQECRNG